MSHLAAYVVPIVLVAWVVYRRIRRTVGFQRFVKSRLLARSIVLGIIGALVVGAGYLRPIAFAGDAVGILAGALLAFAAIRNITFERREGDWYYRTHVWVESVVLVLFVGRLAYRIIESVAAGRHASGTNNLSQLEDPLTAGALLMFVCYYVAFAIALIQREKKLPPPASDEQA
ncbi:MAG TPA: hypothetical protein VMW69_01045 [Spirochaetia bacterium]|nr:hypothetical protein [Spirochaetia bacterium]